jgi:hypothetical protein
MGTPWERSRGCEKIALLPGAQGIDVLVVGRTFGAAIPAVVVVAPVAVLFAVRLIVFVIVTYQITQVKPSWAVMKLRLALGRRPLCA